MRKYEAQVNRGVALLDKKVPEWRDRVDWPTLNMAMCEDCIGGQIAGTFFRFIDEFIPRSKEKGKLDQATWYGFDTEWRAGERCYAGLQREWLRYKPMSGKAKKVKKSTQLTDRKGGPDAL